MKLYGVTGFKNAGKTGLMERLVSEITARGFTVSTLKHAHHSFDVDQPGKDSHRHRTAGAQQTVLASKNRWALMTELRDTPEPSLEDLIAHMAPVDLILIEGWKRNAHPKIEAFRAAPQNPLIAANDPTIKAIASDTPKANNRFDVAGEINGGLPGIGPFWGNPLKRDVANLPRKGLARTANPFPERRVVETLAKGSFTCWQLAGAGAVGSQVMMGLPVLQRLRRTFANKISVWPFMPLDTPIAFVEIWPTLFAGPAPKGMIKDAHQVQATAKAIALRNVTIPHADLHITAPIEGWILSIPQSQQEAWD